LQLKNLINPATGRTEKVFIATSTLKTLKKWDAAGKIYDLLKIKKA